MLAIEEIRKTNLGNVAYVALCFTMLFTAYNSAQNLMAQVYKQLGYDSLGRTCIFTIYTFLGLTNAVTTYFKKKISTKTGLVAGGAAYVSLILIGTLTTYCDKYNITGGLCSTASIYFLNIFCSALCGIGAAFLWISQAIYVNSCSDNETRGSFNGVFWSIMQSSQILASLLAAFLLGFTDQNTFYIVLSIFSIVSLGMMSFVKQPVPYDTQPDQEKGTQATQQESVQDNETLGESLQVFKETLKNNKYFFLFVSLFISGITIGFYANFLTTVVSRTVESTDSNFLNQRLGYALLALALGEVSAGLIVGKIADKNEKISVLNATIIINEVALGVTLVAFIAESYFLAVIAGFLWGFGDTAIQTLINAVIGEFFGGKIELFSAYRFIQSFGVMLASALAIVVPSSFPLLYLIALTGAMFVLHMQFFKYIAGASRDGKNKEALLAAEERVMIELKKF